jgi:hypothetical protein
MKLVKAALIGIIGLAVLVTLISLLIPSEVHGRRGMVIRAERDSIYQQIAVFYNWKNWHPEFKANPSLIRYENVSSGMDAKAMVEVKGKTTTYQLLHADSTTIKVLQKRPGENDIENIFALAKDTATGGIYTDWKFISTLKWYPWEKFAGMLTESMTAPGYEMGLNHLKQFTEAH